MLASSTKSPSKQFDFCLSGYSFCFSCCCFFVFEFWFPQESMNICSFCCFFGLSVFFSVLSCHLLCLCFFSLFLCCLVSLSTNSVLPSPLFSPPPPSPPLTPSLPLDFSSMLRKSTVSRATLIAWRKQYLLMKYHHMPNETKKSKLHQGIF